MKPSLVEQMSQRTLNLVTIIDGQKGQTAKKVMSGLITFEQRLNLAMSQVSTELEDRRSPAAFSAAIKGCMPHAARFGADDMSAVARNAIDALDTLDTNNDPLKGEALAHLIAWISMAAQARVAVKLAFQMSVLYGRAPNGEPLDSDDIEDPFDD